MIHLIITSSLSNLVTHYGLNLFRHNVAIDVGIAPYMAVELAAFDLLPREMTPFARGFSAALLATTCCYPLDTLRWEPHAKHQSEVAE
jgi:hypothetical protein